MECGPENGAESLGALESVSAREEAHTSTSRSPFMPRLVGPEDPEVPRRPDR